MDVALVWAPVEEEMLILSFAEYSPVKYFGLSSRRPGFESRPEHQKFRVFLSVFVFLCRLLPLLSVDD